MHFSHDSDPAIRPSWLAGGGEPADTRPSSLPGGAGDDALDAYSRAVISVVDRAAPALIALRPARGSENQGGSGSGFLVTPDGFAVTNSHVVAGRAKLSATTADGDIIDTTLVGDDPATDLAVVRLTARDLPTVPLMDEPAARVGQLVIAMGSPLGLDTTVSAGIVSAVNRSMRGIGGRLIDGVVQHTAPINPGNSGGPLLDSRSRVVGVNTAAIAFAQSVGFAVPAATVRWVVGEILAHGRIVRPLLGIAAGPAAIPRRLARELDLLNEHGVAVHSVQAGSPAAGADLREGDIIVSFGDRLVSGIDDLHRMLARLKPGSPVALTIVRGRSKFEVTLKAATAGN